MTFATIDQVSAGGALQLVLLPRPGATSMRVTRGATQAELVDENAGTIVYEGDDLYFLDGPGLVNGTPLWYRPFYLINSAWVAADAQYQTPVASFADYSVDVVAILRDCLRKGLAELVARTKAKSTIPGPVLAPASGFVPVVFGTSDYDNIAFPCVTLHVAADDDARRAIGETVELDDPGEEYEGWLSQYSVAIVGWSKSYDERVQLRKAIKTIVIANLAIFEAAGIQLPGLRLSDQDDVTSFPAPIYQAVGTFTCSAASVVGQARPVVADVSVQLNGGFDA